MSTHLRVWFCILVCTRTQLHLNHVADQFSRLLQCISRPRHVRRVCVCQLRGGRTVRRSSNQDDFLKGWSFTFDRASDAVVLEEIQVTSLVPDIFHGKEGLHEHHRLCVELFIRYWSREHSEAAVKCFYRSWSQQSDQSWLGEAKDQEEEEDRTETAKEHTLYMDASSRL